MSGRLLARFRAWRRRRHCARHGHQRHEQIPPDLPVLVQLILANTCAHCGGDLPAPAGTVILEAPYGIGKAPAIICEVSA